MSNTFKNAKLAMTTGGGTVYTCPPATTAIVIGGQIANIDGVNAANATVAWTDASDSNAATNLLKTVPVAPGSAIPVCIGKLVLAAGDTVTALASADGDLVITLSVLEMS